MVRSAFVGKGVTNILTMIVLSLMNYASLHC